MQMVTTALPQIFLSEGFLEHTESTVLERTLFTHAVVGVACVPQSVGSVLFAFTRAYLGVQIF
eukprot:3971591-Amphidinium_carterae.1